MKPSTYISVYDPIETLAQKHPLLQSGLDWYESLWYDGSKEIFSAIGPQLASNGIFTVQQVSKAETTERAAETNNIKISISVKGPKKDVISGQALVLMIHYDNVSSNRTFVFRRPLVDELDSQNLFVIVSPDRMVYSVTPELYAGSNVMTRLDPHHTLDIEVDLTKLFRFDKLGTYKIRAKRKVTGAVNNVPFITTIVSSPLDVTIVPATK